MVASLLRRRKGVATANLSVPSRVKEVMPMSSHGFVGIAVEVGIL
jgi:hypothetical protein